MFFYMLSCVCVCVANVYWLLFSLLKRLTIIVKKGGAENDRHEIAGHKIAGHEITGHDIARRLLFCT